MKAEFLQSKPGHARVVISQLNESPEAGKPYGVSLQRSSDKSFLGRTGRNTWTTQEESLALTCLVDGENLVFELGPDFVNYLTPDNYRIYLRLGNERLGHSGLSIQDVLTEELTSSQSMSDTGVKTASHQGAQVAAAVAAAPTEEVPPPAEPEIGPEPAPEPEKIEMPAVEQADENKNGINPLLIIIPIIFVLIAGAAVWYFMFFKKAPAVETEQEKPAIQEEAKPDQKKDDGKKDEAKSPEKPQPESDKQVKPEPKPEPRQEPAPAPTTGATPAPAPTPVLSAREQVRAFFDDPQRSPEKAYSLSQTIKPESGEQKDAIFRLLYFAAQGDYSQAYFGYANCVDPLTPPWGTIKKDALEAWDYYKKSGTAEGTEAMNKLLEHMRAEAGRGNAEAARWLKDTGNQ